MTIETSGKPADDHDRDLEELDLDLLDEVTGGREVTVNITFN